MSDTQRIRHIDAWRFIAVSLVILAHVIERSNLINAYPLLRRIVPFGQFGVLIFFFISGFVICRGLMGERVKTGTVSLKAFYIRRCFRILPPLWLYLATLAVLAAAGAINMTGPQIGRSALFLCNIQFLGDCTWYAGHTWSLAYEEQFYVLFPLLFVAIGLAARPRIILVLVLLTMALSVASHAAGINGGAYYLMRMNFLLMWCAVALYYHRLRGIFQRLPPGYWLATGGGLIVCVGLLPDPLEIYLRTILYPAGIALLVLGTPVSHPKVREFFQNPLLAYLGKISYTVYLWQQLATDQYPTLSLWWTVLFIFGIWLFAHFSYQYFERPLIGIASRWSEAIKRRAFFGRAVGSSS